MDENKAQVLRDIGYEIGPTCGTCRHSDIGYDEAFGTCEIHEYVHLKHSGKARKLSVYHYGHCPKFERADFVEHQIHGFKEFVDG